MDELARMMDGNAEGGRAFNRLIDTMYPESLGAQKRAREIVVLADPVSWSLNTGIQAPGSSNTISISNKGILDLKRSYVEFRWDLVNGKTVYPHPFEVVSWQIGSLQQQLPYNGFLQDAHYLRSEREELSREGSACDVAFAKPGLVATYGTDIAENGAGIYRVPFSRLCAAFEEMGHIFVGLGQVFSVQLRLRSAGELMTYSGGVPSYSVNRGRLILSYVELDSASMDRVIRSRVQLNLPHHQAIPVPITATMNLQFSVSRKDLIRYLVLVPKLKDSDNTAVAADATGATANYWSGIIRPKTPFRRIQVTMGQQNLVILSQGMAAAADEHINANLSPFPFTIQNSKLREFFNPTIIDLSRFGLDEDAHGAGIETQTVLVQVELNPSAVLGPLFTGAWYAADMGMMHAYLCTANQVSLENGLYKRD